jgi:1-acyl-sn-glycerol-3-phosphate acyltransferase
LWQRVSWNLGRSISRVLSVLLFRFRARGQCRLPARGGILLVSNHQSFLDPWLMGIAVSRQVHYMARDTLFQGGFLQFLGEIWNAFPVRRGAADLAAIRMGVERLEKGFMLNIFPEGTRSEDGSIGAMSAGMTLVLNRCKTDVVIVPVVIDGAFEVWPRGVKFPRFFGGGGRRGIRVFYGRAIGASEWRAWEAEELALKVRAEMVRMQRDMGNVHAAESEQKLAADLAAREARGGERTRRRRGR